MTEQSYIIVRNLSNIKAALDLIGSVLPDESGVITDDEREQISDMLYTLLMKHYVEVERIRDEVEEGQ